MKKPKRRGSHHQSRFPSLHRRSPSRRRAWRPQAVVHGKDLAAGTRIADAKGAAAHGLLAALNVNEGQRGVVRILVQSAEQKREVINFLTAFLSDEPRLKRLLKRATPDTFLLHGNISIHVDANSARLGKDVISSDRLGSRRPMRRSALSGSNPAKPRRMRPLVRLEARAGQPTDEYSLARSRAR